MCTKFKELLCKSNINMQELRWYWRKFYSMFTFSSMGLVAYESPSCCGCSQISDVHPSLLPSAFLPTTSSSTALLSSIWPYSLLKCPHHLSIPFQHIRHSPCQTLSHYFSLGALSSHLAFPKSLCFVKLSIFLGVFHVWTVCSINDLIHMLWISVQFLNYILLVTKGFQT